MTYSDFKKWLEEHKPQIILGLCFVLVFLLGFGVGKFDKYQNRRQKPQNDYSKNSTSQQNEKKTVGEGNAIKTELVEALATTTSQVSIPIITECKIKGNISSGGKKIYHIKGGASYNVVKPEMCFSTEEEARAGGFVKSLR